MISQIEILKRLEENKKQLCKQFHIQKLGLFGSYSKGNPQPDSDIDIVYELEEGEFLGIKEITLLETLFKNLLETERIDLVNKKYMNPLIAIDMANSVVYV